MRRCAPLLFAVAACGFQAHSRAGDGGTDATPFGSDGSITIDAPDDGNAPGIDARQCFGTSDPICLSAVPQAPLAVPAGTINTGVDASCTEVVGGQCVLAGTQVTVNGATIAIGSRPLVIIATDMLTIGGTLDVSSTVVPRRIGAGANASACTVPTAGTSDSGGGGGGAGGSFGTAGGGGGTGDTNNNHPPNGMAPGGRAGAAQVAMHLRGGCPGSPGGEGDDPSTNAGDSPGGQGGDGGGAVRLIAATSITVGGGVYASGAGGGATPGTPACSTATNGGYEQGGGGAGAGGMIWIDAPALTIGGKLVANGGGGGGGGGCYGGSPGPNGTTTMWNTRASGGTGETTDGGGYGGAGAAINATTGVDGISAQSGAGGGGGGVGVIWLDGTINGGTQVSPPRTAH